jgi:3-mercaptopyruvate sulfurtransferase SseA
LTSSDGTVAAFAAADIAGLGSRSVVALTGGTAAWRDAGFPIETGNKILVHPFEDTARSAYQINSDRFAAFRDLGDWTGRPTGLTSECLDPVRFRGLSTDDRLRRPGRKSFGRSY